MLPCTPNHTCQKGLGTLSCHHICVARLVWIDVSLGCKIWSPKNNCPHCFTSISGIIISTVLVCTIKFFFFFSSQWRSLQYYCSLLPTYLLLLELSFLSHTQLLTKKIFYFGVASGIIHLQNTSYVTDVCFCCSSLPNALITLFQLFTLDQWYKIYNDLIKVSSMAFTCTYIILWVWIGSFVFRNLFVGIMG